MITTFSFSIAIAALFVASIGAVLGFLAWSSVVGLKNSTHKLQYVYVKDPEYKKFGDKDLKPQYDDESGEELPPDEEVSLLKQFKQAIYRDEEN